MWCYTLHKFLVKLKKIFICLIELFLKINRKTNNFFFIKYNHTEIFFSFVYIKKLTITKALIKSFSLFQRFNLLPLHITLFDSFSKNK